MAIADVEVTNTHSRPHVATGNLPAELRFRPDIRVNGERSSERVRL
jgi:hypothetical protein